MGLAKQERELAAVGKGCLGKAKDDEPVFILRAQDKVMVPALHAWIDIVVGHLGNAHPKVAEARALLAQVREWQANNYNKYPD